MRDRLFGSVGSIARSMTVRVILGGSIVLATLGALYWILVPLVPKGPPKPAPRAALVAPTQVNALPRIEGAAPLALRWDAVNGLNATEIPGERLHPGQPVLKLAGLPGEGRHRIGIVVTGLAAGQRVRVTGSVRAAAGIRLGLDLRDGKSAHHGLAVFDVGSPASGATGEIIRPSLDADTSGWTRISAGLQSEDGVIVVYIGLLDSANRDVFKVTEPMEFDFRGIDVSPE